MRKTLLLILVICATASSLTAALPEKLRVLSIDLENSLIEAPGLPGGETAQELRNLLEKADPDVICLQGANDWESCERIIKLKPGFRIITCSAFQAKGASTSVPQVAILARDRAVISWVEEISDGGGFAFALLQSGSRKLGVFSLQNTKSAAAGSMPATERVLAEVARLIKFPQNRPDSFLITGSPLVKSSAVIDAGFQNISPEAPAPNALTRPEFWVSNAGFIARPRAVAIKGLRAPALISDFDAGSIFSSKFAYQTPLLFAGETPASLQAAAAPPPVAPQTRSLAWPISVGVGLALLALVILFRRGNRPQNQMQLVPMGALGSIDSPVIANQLQQDPIRHHLLAWFKTLFVQRLLSQRQQLLSTEAEATRRTLDIEEKLSTLQTTLQGRISAYESRIERLEHELTAANVENRDLIRSQIDLLREKVAKAKEEHAFRRN